MTAQIPEKLILNGELVSMVHCPSLPKSHFRIAQVDTENLEDIENTDILSTACWRRFVGTWEIKNGLLYLKSIEGCYRMIGREPLLADWFSGVIRACKGDLIEYVHAGLASAYEHEINLKIENGKVLSRNPFTTNQVEADKWLRRIALAQANGRLDLVPLAKSMHEHHIKNLKTLHLHEYSRRIKPQIEPTYTSTSSEYANKLTTALNLMLALPQDEFIDIYPLLTTLASRLPTTL